MLEAGKQHARETQTFPNSNPTGTVVFLTARTFWRTLGNSRKTSGASGQTARGESNHEMFARQTALQ